MRFTPRQSPTPYLNRRDQYRLLGMVALLGLLMVAIEWTSRPESWRWLIPVNGSPAASAESREPRSPGPAGEDAGADVRLPAEVSGTVTIGETDADDRLIPLELLADIRDNTLGWRRPELPALQRALQAVEGLAAEEASQRARTDVTYTVLMLHPEDCRGRLVTLTGELRRLLPIEVPEELNSEPLYEGWMFTSDSHTRPIRYLCRALPPGVSPAETMSPTLVQVTGCFVKRSAYAAVGGQRVAPLLVCQSFRLWPSPAPVVPEGPGLEQFVRGMVVLIVVALIIMFWQFLVTRRRSGARLRPGQDATPPDLRGLALGGNAAAACELSPGE
jgi:hypothetical protein